MRKVVLTLLSMTLVAGAVRAQGQDPSHWAEKLVVGYETEGPKVLTKDFGVVARGGQLLHTFKLYNPYKVALTIDTKVECNCVTVSPKSFVIQSKQGADLNITMDTTRFVGNKNVHIEVYTGPPPYTQPEPLKLLVMAQIRADLVLNPGHINLGTMKSGQAAAPQYLDVEYAGAVDFRIAEVVEHNAPVKLSFKELYRRPGPINNVGYRVTAELKEGAAAGGFRQELFLRTNDPAGPLLPIPVEGSVQASLSAVPNTLELGNMKLGEEKQQRVMVRGGRPFRIIGIEGAGEGITYELPTAPSMIQTVVFHYQAGKTGDVSRKIQIKTDLGSENAVSIKVEGAVGP
ncbi:MAG TPA: DUF1573 domain-containing protein [Gemmataceae bacterium]|jgi:hypothetical protein|nr:DUF1573 domain-containing protein [Gemmataceae bacterium]